jgi:hypothetical protein
MREIRPSGSEGGGTKPIVSSYPYIGRRSRLQKPLSLRIPLSLHKKLLCKAPTEEINPSDRSQCDVF